MKTNVYLGIVIRIILLFGTGMLFGKFSPWLHDFFGDVKLKYPQNKGFCIDVWYGWSAMHYWYWWMCFVLFLVSIVNVIVGIIQLIKRNYDTSKWG